MDTRQLHINGQWVDSAGAATIAVGNPATEEVIARISVGTEADAIRALEASQAALPASYEELGGTEIFLASSGSNYVSGTIVTVDGGWMGRLGTA
ncbi:MAG: hypothetical protein HN904_11335 [Victivallales bacterium]|jgi:NAD(P)-dependent dehydrogenase (short-subunit alcohol dehydrogenase family)|nr:hypothetical protein [Victivallales bacterium]MBT7163365.1 hypothetical protein [Victivallales bacterium]